MEAETQIVSTDSGLRIAYERTGAGPPVILLHGFIVDRRTWRPQLENLSRDFDVIAWDAKYAPRPATAPVISTPAQPTPAPAGL